MRVSARHVAASFIVHHASSMPGHGQRHPWPDGRVADDRIRFLSSEPIDLT
jgi:hypothetical protein